MWYRIICGALTTSPLVPTEALMKSLRVIEKQRVVVTKVMARRIQDQRVPIMMACMWNLVGSDTQGMQSEI